MTERIAFRVFAAATLALAAAGLTVQPAGAQDALGSGNVLDANPGAAGRGNLPAQVPDYRARNMLITGDVAGGRGFRGAVGYTAPGDFRDTLGSDDLFRFRAQSAFSNLAVISSMGDQFRVGQSLGIAEFRRDPYVAGGDIMRAPQMDSFDYTDVGLSDRIRMDQQIRASAVSDMRLDDRSRIVGSLVDEDGRRLAIDASPLTGLASMPLDQRIFTQGLTTLDRIRLRDDLVQGRVDTFGRPVQWRFEDFAQGDAPSLRDDDRGAMDRQFPGERDDQGFAREADDRVGSFRPGEAFEDPRDRTRRDVPTARPTRDVRHRQIIERIVSRYAGSDNVDLNVDSRVLRELDESFENLRAQLQGTTPDRRAAGDPTAPASWAQPERPDDAPQPVTPDVVDTRADAEDADEDDDRFDPSRLAPALRHGEQVRELTGQQQSRFNELMAMGEQSLSSGEYFLAERRFTRALRFHPGEPMATAGLGHAQLGAGLHIAAGLTLQRMFTTNPEMIDVSYDPDLLPSDARLTQAVAQLQQRLDEQRDRRTIGFLLAYIGHLLEDDAIMEQGLGVMEDVRADDPLASLMREVWFGEDE